VLKGKEQGYATRPGSEIPDEDLLALQKSVALKHARRDVSWRDTLSAAMYPAVFDDYVRKLNLHGPLTRLPTKAFLVGLDIDEECEIELRGGRARERQAEGDRRAPAQRQPRGVLRDERNSARRRD
jgi:pyruvate carboxylase